MNSNCVSIVPHALRRTKRPHWPQSYRQDLTSDHRDGGVLDLQALHLTELPRGSLLRCLQAAEDWRGNAAELLDVSHLHFAKQHQPKSLRRLWSPPCRCTKRRVFSNTSVQRDEHGAAKEVWLLLFPCGSSAAIVHEVEGHDPYMRRVSNTSSFFVRGKI